MIQKTNRPQTISYALLLRLWLIVGLCPTQLMASTAPQTEKEVFKILTTQSVEGDQDIMVLFIGSTNDTICQQYIGFISKEDFQKKLEQTTYAIQAYKIQAMVSKGDVPVKFYFRTSIKDTAIAL